MPWACEDLNDHETLRHDPGIQTAVGRDQALPVVRSRGVLAGYKAKIAHQLTRTVAARQVAKFGQHGHRHDDVDTAQADQCFHHRLQRPRLHCHENLVLKAATRRCASSTVNAGVNFPSFRFW